MPAASGRSHPASTTTAAITATATAPSMALDASLLQPRRPSVFESLLAYLRMSRSCCQSHPLLFLPRRLLCIARVPSTGVQRLACLSTQRRGHSSATSDSIARAAHSNSLTSASNLSYHSTLTAHRVRSIRSAYSSHPTLPAYPAYSTDSDSPAPRTSAESSRRAVGQLAAMRQPEQILVCPSRPPSRRRNRLISNRSPRLPQTRLRFPERPGTNPEPATDSQADTNPLDRHAASPWHHRSPELDSLLRERIEADPAAFSNQFKELVAAGDYQNASAVFAHFISQMTRTNPGDALEKLECEAATFSSLEDTLNGKAENTSIELLLTIMEHACALKLALDAQLARRAVEFTCRAQALTVVQLNGLLGRLFALFVQAEVHIDRETGLQTLTTLLRRGWPTVVTALDCHLGSRRGYFDLQDRHELVSDMARHSNLGTAVGFFELLARDDRYRCIYDHPQMQKTLISIFRRLVAASEAGLLRRMYALARSASPSPPAARVHVFLVTEIYKRHMDPTFVLADLKTIADSDGVINDSAILTRLLRIDPALALQFFKDMRSSGILPSSESYTALIVHYTSNLHLDEEIAIRLFEDLTATVHTLSVQVYFRMFKLMVVLSKSEAGTHLVQQLQQVKPQLSAKTFGLLLSLHGKDQNVEMINSLISASKALPGKHSRSLNLYFEIILALVRCNMMESAEKQLNEIVALVESGEGIWSGSYHYDATERRWTYVPVKHGRMITAISDLPPDHFNIIIQGYLQTDRLAEAHRLFMGFREMGISPNSYTLTFFGEYFAQKGQIINLKLIFEELDSLKIRPTNQFYCSILSHLLSLENAQEYDQYVDWILDHMNRAGIEPNHFTWNVILRMYSRREPHRAYELWGQLATREAALQPRNSSSDRDLATRSIRAPASASPILEGKRRWGSNLAPDPHSEPAETSEALEKGIEHRRNRRKEIMEGQIQSAFKEWGRPRRAIVSNTRTTQLMGDLCFRQAHRAQELGDTRLCELWIARAKRILEHSLGHGLALTPSVLQFYVRRLCNLNEPEVALTTLSQVLDRLIRLEEGRAGVHDLSKIPTVQTYEQSMLWDKIRHDQTCQTTAVATLSSNTLATTTTTTTTTMVDAELMVDLVEKLAEQTRAQEHRPTKSQIRSATDPAARLVADTPSTSDSPKRNLGGAGAAGSTTGKRAALAGLYGRLKRLHGLGTGIVSEEALLVVESAIQWRRADDKT
ncbi:uncharacterized protein BJ171DRAFT_514703 [Polychytrium aggregatum]|uniref:uncharacterized protein n=1 Tax=Polychytrium aggregatum TaxID=110093 RepID=UPI0022FEC872|nr:uncharacterized protein BJ171DRAFT_514703 [Polychytrium aggregatum]KAI9202316.1 hypothetical protein BJ171DRAFT_514703 [Polychytrium aggregatum]